MGSAMPFDERIIFSPRLPVAVNRLLQAGVAASRDNAAEALRLFHAAQAQAPQCLQTYFALYKLYFHLLRFSEAEQVVMAALAEAGRQGGFYANWKLLGQERASWGFYEHEAGLFYLFSLKALAFIKLRQGHAHDARTLLDTICLLDPEDRSGASVILSLADALQA